MARRGFFGSLFTALIIAAVVFLCLYFFAPSFSERFFGISWSMRRTGMTIGQNAELKELTDDLSSFMEDAGLSKNEIKKIQKTLQEKMKSIDFREQVSNAVSAGKDAVTSLLDEMK
ncbi:MAG: hypothetical protein SPD11_11960 [Sphaerochaetaceae bacterium]|nr:hypothetical protein [Sphaerochaetaceae bacterium]